MRLLLSSRPLLLWLVYACTLGLFGCAKPDPPNSGPASDSEQHDLHQLVTLLQYVGEEFPEAVEEAYASELLEQRRMAAVMTETATRLGPAGVPYLAALRSIESRIERQEDAIQVSKDCETLAADILRDRHIATGPAAAPNLERGQTLFESSCASCHLRERFMMLADHRKMQPPPANFFDAEIMNHLSPFKAYNVITFGVPGTAMAPFESALDAGDRWSLAFYVFTLRQPACEAARPDVPLASVAVASDQELAVTQRESGLACLRHNPAGAGNLAATKGGRRRPAWLAKATGAGALLGTGLLSVVFIRRRRRGLVR